MTKLLHLILGSNLGPALNAVREAAYGTGGIGLGEVVQYFADRIRKEYLGKRIPEGTEASAKRMRGYEDELAEAERFLRTWLTERYTRWRREHDIALIERPLLEHRLREGLIRKGVPFLFETRGEHNVLTLRVIGTHFLEIRVSQDNVDRVTLLAPYLVQFPHRAREEFPGCVNIKTSSELAKMWDTVCIRE